VGRDRVWALLCTVLIPFVKVCAPWRAEHRAVSISLCCQSPHHQLHHSVQGKMDEYFETVGGHTRILGRVEEANTEGMTWRECVAVRLKEWFIRVYPCVACCAGLACMRFLSVLS
jgi:hypothetical protein